MSASVRYSSVMNLSRSLFGPFCGEEIYEPVTLVRFGERPIDEAPCQSLGSARSSVVALRLCCRTLCFPVILFITMAATCCLRLVGCAYLKTTFSVHSCTGGPAIALTGVRVLP